MHIQCQYFIQGETLSHWAARTAIKETERGAETSETGGAQRSARLGKRVGDWRSREQIHDSQIKG
jgi:hypothetical protein